MKKVLLALFLMTVVNSCNMNKKDFLVIGHRGAMGHETENTLPSIQKAMDLGVDMIEIDVFKIRSGEIVVFHDEQLDRLANAGGKIEEYYISEINQVILDGGHKIPQLQDVLKLIDNKVALNIELKGANTADRVNFIMNYYVEKRGWEWKNVVISSFNWDELREMRKKNPDVAIAVLTEDEDPTKAIPVAKELNAVAVNPWFKTLNGENVKTLQDAGFKVYTYTVNETEDIEKMREYGVDGIFINYPERAM
ncbi:glycerophosphodiester phosphodiesterase [Croceivirga thetidis]|nr:glycerophosphodiester phosphodiesterase [Croceivirga thetidis]